jgi:hypothetical protein
MSGLEPVDQKRGVAKFDGRSLAIPDPTRTAVPETGASAGPEQGYPYAMAGQAWRTGRSASATTRNAFDATLTGASAVTLHTVRMRIDVRRPVSGQLSTGSPLALKLDGNWPSSLIVNLDGVAVSFQRSTHAISLAVPSGRHEIAIVPLPSAGARR